MSQATTTRRDLVNNASLHAHSRHFFVFPTRASFLPNTIIANYTELAIRSYSYYIKDLQLPC